MEEGENDSSHVQSSLFPSSLLPPPSYLLPPPSYLLPPPSSLLSPLSKMNTSRRVFLKSGALALASVGLMPGIGPEFLRGTAFAADDKRNTRKAGGKKIMVCIFLRGAVDGLSMVVPHGDPDYYKLREVNGNGIALPRTGKEGVIDLDGKFGLNPALAALKPLYDAGHLAPIQAVGSPHSTRSHFDAQDYMESAVPGNKSLNTGWLARVSAQCPEDTGKGKQIQTVSMTSRLPRSLDGDAEALAISDLATFGVGRGTGGGGKKGAAAMAASMGGRSGNTGGGFEALYDGAVGDVLHGAGQETFEALKILSSLDPNKYAPDGKANYGNSQLGRSLRQIAQMIKADVGTEIAFAETGGWDTHANQGGSNGQLSRKLGDVGQALAAFWTDMGDRMGGITVLTMSEFGRTARQNGNGGTDHGHGTCFLALGGDVAGGKVRGQWPGLSPDKLYENRDLAVTTDFRSVFAEIADKHMGIKDMQAVFPGFAADAKDYRGVIR